LPTIRLLEGSRSYTVSGTTARGAPLFSLSFDPAPLDHGDERHFMFAIPLSAGQRAAAPMVIVREPGTGRVLGVGESGHLTLSTRATAVDVLMSDGIGSVVTTLTRR
jgi:hypothetical protein